ncbi:aspartate-semialdehyde dehydrogenase [Senegalia massiliensis]|uniref:aspartate-semialdehyde dehydrogenase n=1 Tax=Senegalia massiliensis TaxID=1720316 RepID=UPI0010321992|nr:aspartate-semialdehyde dehydrogenase [Senegalia massiliensis]
MKKFNVAIVGARGAVGKKVMELLVERNFPINKLKLLGSEKGTGIQIKFKDENLVTEEACKGAFEGLDIAFFCVDKEISEKLAPIAIDEGCIVIDNSSCFRMNKEVPLIIPEINPHDIDFHKGIIANPNCSTIQMLVALKPIHDIYNIKRIVVSTYQSVSGSGKKAIDELNDQVKDYIAGNNISNSIYPHQISFNAIPHIDDFIDNGYTKEEMKMVNETKKILDENIEVSATAVRIPVIKGHCESINIQTKKKIDPESVKELLSKFKGIKVLDDPLNNLYPIPITVEETDYVYVGRIRKDFTIKNGLNIWVVSDNLRKGAALNAIQIAELLIDRILKY